MIKTTATGAVREVGIVSYGNGCARPGFPGVYSEVQAFSDAPKAKISASGGLSSGRWIRPGVHSGRPA